MKRGNSGGRGLKDPSVLDAAGALYLAGVRAKPVSKRGASGGVALDQVTATFLREQKSQKWGGDEESRGIVVDTAQGMWRARRRLEAALKHLPYEPTRGAIAALYLLGARALDPSQLPIDQRGAPELVEAWNKTATAPLDVRASLPAWLVDALLRARGATEGEALCLSFLQTPRTSLRANTLKTTRDDLIAVLSRDGIAASVSELSPDGVVLDKRANVFRTQAFRDGLFEVQDEGSQLIGRLVAPSTSAGAVVVDACAGAGGKTLHLAAMMNGKGTMHAFDVVTHRLDALRERAKRAGAHNIRVHAVGTDEATNALTKLQGAADAVLIDAPCTGTGVLRRNPDTSWSLTESDVARLVKEQAKILDTYASLVKPGGRLVYATCSLLDEENAATVTAFLARDAGKQFTRVRAKELLDAAVGDGGMGLAGSTRAAGSASAGLGAAAGTAPPAVEPVAGAADVVALDPLRHGTDGFYACALLRGEGL